MDNQTFINGILELWDAPEFNEIREEDAFRPDLAGMKVFRKPLFGISCAADPLYLKLREPGVVDPEFILPEEWLPGAKSVITYFLPFSYAVLDHGMSVPVGGYPFGPDGPEQYAWPSDEWQQARIEGEAMNVARKRLMKEYLEQMGFRALVPSDDPRYKVVEPSYCTWSERHAAFISGLGTFSMSKGLITAEGMAGRFGSVITDLELTPTERPYTGIYEYCIRCGLCAKSCPAGCIDASKPLDEAKDKGLCGQYLQYLKDYSAAGGDTRLPEERDRWPRKNYVQHFGCSGCQVSMPCKRGIPRL